MSAVHPDDQRSTLGDVLAARVQRHPDRTFVRFGDDRRTYRDIDDAAGALASGLAALGVGRGDRVAIVLPNSAEFVVAVFGITRLGAIEVPINTALKGHLLAYQLADAAVRVLITSDEMFDRCAAVFDQVPSLMHALVVGESAGGSVGAVAVHSFAAVTDGATPFEQPSPPVRHSDIAAIMYTSGTTGASKGVEVTHGHCLSFAADWLTATAYRTEDVLFSPLPLFHALAHTLGMVPVLLVGSQMAITPRFSASTYWDECRRFGATVGHGIFGMVPILLNQPPREDDRDHSVRCFYIGPSSLSDAFEDRFGAVIVEVFGMTETGVVTCTPYGERRPGSCGRPNASSFEVRIVDDDDQDVDIDAIGEIVLRPTRPFTMMSGYHGKPEATVEAWRNLWFHTGDFGRMDADGYVFFVDRKKDSIRRRGENVSSFEVERAINTHPSVLESAVIAVPSPLGEDEIAAVIVPHPGHTIDFVALVSFLDDALPYFMVPRYFRTRASLPKTPNEKVQKFELRGEGRLGITDDCWDREAAGVRLTR